MKTPMLAPAHDSRLCFPVLPRCSSHPYVGNQCRATAAVWLYAPDGEPVPGGWLCLEHGQAITGEYRAKLGEAWALRPLHLYKRSAFGPCAEIV